VISHAPPIQSADNPVSATLAILAGGEGSRMGRPKADLRVNGVPLLEYLHRRIAWLGPTLLVTAPGRERPPGADQFDREVTDSVSGAGPLRGILTALENATTSLLLVAAIDMPHVARTHLLWLAQRLRAAPEAAGFLCSRTVGQVEPLPCALRVATATPQVRDALNAGRRSLRSLLDLPGFNLVDVPTDWPEDVWTNLNEPQAWGAFLEDQID
jgi:molybdenum cofactor guanylyltransferase